MWCEHWLVEPPLPTPLERVYLPPADSPTVVREGAEPRVPEGRGMFAAVDIPKDGVLVAAQCSCSACSGVAVTGAFGVYCIAAWGKVRGFRAIPAGPLVAMTGFAQLANHDPNRVNAAFRTFSGLGIVLVATRNIRAGEQIIVDYGSLYTTHHFSPLS